MKNFFQYFLFMLFFFVLSPNSPAIQLDRTNFFDTNDHKIVNNHAGSILFYKGTYYWYGENRSPKGPVLTGFGLYTSKDLKYWKSNGLVFNIKTVSKDNKDIEFGAVYERPKVIYNKKNNNFVMFFHFERKGEGYKSALVGVATSDSPTGPFNLKSIFRLNKDVLPVNVSNLSGLNNGSVFLRDFHKGQMSRDLNVFVDGDNKAYLISSSEDNKTLIITRLNEDFTGLTKYFVRVAPGGYNEAPILFKRNNKYFIISSGTSGWVPNKARLYSSNDILGSWKYMGTPINSNSKDDINTTFHSQGAFLLNYKGGYYIVSDKWDQSNLQSSLYSIFPLIWINGIPYISNK